MRVVVARPAGLDAADERFAGAVTVNCEHRGTGSGAFLRDQHVRRHRHGCLGVEHNSPSRIGAAVGLLGGLEREINRFGARTEERIEPRVRPIAPLIELRVEIVEGARIVLDDALQMQPPVRPVGEVARLAVAHADNVQANPPTRCCRYGGDSHAAGK